MEQKPKGVQPASLKNLTDRSAPDRPQDTTPITVRLRTEDLEWLRSQPEGVSYHVRQAVRQYRAAGNGQAPAA